MMDVGKVSHYFEMLNHQFEKVFNNFEILIEILSHYFEFHQYFRKPLIVDVQLHVII